MKFNYSEKAKYMVSIYGWNVCDHLYYESLEKAEAKYEELCKQDYALGTLVSLYNLATDQHEAYKAWCNVEE